MRAWVWSGQTAVLLGSLAFLVLLVPVLSWQYRRYGRVNGARLLGAAATSLYLTALVTYTWLPLPTRGHEQCVTGPQLQPFRFVEDIQHAMGSPGWTGFVSSTTVQQVVFNVVLFVPWGVIARRFVGMSILAATLSGLLASLFIELTQLTGLWGIYECSYRLADVDDVLTNTLGALIGALIAPVLLWWMPRTSDLERARLQARPVTAARRVASMLLDAGGLLLIELLVAVFLRLGVVAYGNHLTDDVLRRTEQAGSVVAWLVVFALPAVLGKGSLGLAATWLQPMWPDGTSGGPRGLLRASVVSVPWLASVGFPDATWLLALLWALVVASLVSAFTTRNHRGLSCWLTAAELLDVRSNSPRPTGRHP